MLTAENYCLSVSIESSIELGPGIRPLFSPDSKVVSKAECPNLVPLALALPNGETAAEFCVATQTMSRPANDSERRIEIRDRHIVETLRVNAGAGGQCELLRFVSTSRRDNAEAVISAAKHLRAAVSTGISPALSAHEAEWRARWESADVQVDGDERFAAGTSFRGIPPY